MVDQISNQHPKRLHFIASFKDAKGQEYNILRDFDETLQPALKCYKGTRKLLFDFPANCYLVVGFHDDVFVAYDGSYVLVSTKGELITSTRYNSIRYVKKGFYAGIREYIETDSCINIDFINLNRTEIISSELVIPFLEYSMGNPSTGLSIDSLESIEASYENWEHTKTFLKGIFAFSRMDFNNSLYFFSLTLEKDKDIDESDYQYQSVNSAAIKMIDNTIMMLKQ